MSYHVTLTNQSPYVIRTFDQQTVNPNGGTWTSPLLGNGWAATQQLGAINFLDIADKHIPGDTTETWGVLISYQGEEMVGRYEGGGQLNVLVNQFGQVQLSGMDMRQVYLPAFIQ